VLLRQLDHLLEKSKKTRYWLARQTGISEGNLRRLAKGETSAIEFETLEKICKELNCQPGDLLVFVEDKAKNT